MTEFLVRQVRSKVNNDAQGKYPTSTLADLYDPLTMPAPLLQAHQDLDRAVDRCYRPDPGSVIEWVMDMETNAPACFYRLRGP